MPPGKHVRQHRIAPRTRSGNVRDVDYIGVRVGVELRARAIHAAAQLGIPLSEWLRMAVASALDYGINGISTPADPEATGYQHGRALGLALAQQQIQQVIHTAAEAIPMTLDEAIERGLLPQSGAINGVY